MEIRHYNGVDVTYIPSSGMLQTRGKNDEQLGLFYVSEED